MATLDIIVKPKLKFSLKRCGEVVPYGITPEEKAKLAGIEENANKYTHPAKHPSSILDVVDVVNGAANKFLNERGEMVAVAHENLTDKNSEAAFQHIDTTFTKPTLDAADMVAVKDSVTGKIVLTPKSNLAGDNVLLDYTHSGNKEVYVSAIDYTTHTFTSIGHGLSNGSRLSLLLLPSANSQTSYLSTCPINTNETIGGYYVINSTENTFQLSNSIGGAAIQTINKGTINFNFFRFEVASEVTFSIPNFPANGVKIDVFGAIPRLHGYIAVNGNFSVYTWYLDFEKALYSAGNIGSSANLLHGIYSLTVKKYLKSFIQIREWQGILFNQSNQNTFSSRSGKYTLIPSNEFNSEINSIGSGSPNGFLLLNGTTLKIYKL